MTQTLTPEREKLLRSIDAVIKAAEPGKLRAVAYLRVSTEEQRKGYGISYTGKRVVRHISRKGWALADVFADEGYSGSLEWQDRPDLKRLMELARQPRRGFDVVCVAEGRAIGRRDRAFWPWVWGLEEIGIFVAVVKGDYDNTTAEGRSRMRKDADRAEDERETILDRTQGGLQEKAEEGGYTGGFVPFGYEIENQGVKGESRLVLRKAECQTLHRARETFVRVRNWSDAAAALNSEGMLTRSGRPWSRQNLHHIMLGDPVLNSRIIFRKKKKAKLDRDGKPMYGESVVIALPSVFTPEEVDELKEAVALTRNGPPVHRGRVYILSNRMTAPCGRKYTGHMKNGRVPGYRCSGDGCACVFLQAEVTEGAFWDKFCATLGNGKRLRKVAQDWSRASAGQGIDYAQRIADLDKQITVLRRTRDITLSMAVREAIAEGATDAEAEDAAAAAVRSIGDELASLQKLKSEATAWQAQSLEAGSRSRDLLAMAKTAHEKLESLPLHQRLRLLQLLTTEVTVRKEPAKGRQGASCTLAAWFRERERLVPVLTDEGWQSVAPLLPELRRLQPRRVLEAMLYKARTGVQWRHLPGEYGNGESVHTHWVRWSKNGIWQEAMDLLPEAGGAEPYQLWTAPSMSIRTWVIPELLLDTDQYLATRSGSRASGEVLFKFPLIMPP